MNRTIQIIKRTVLLISTITLMSCSNMIKTRDDNVSGTNAYIKLSVDKARTVLPDFEANLSNFKLTGVKTEAYSNTTPESQDLGTWGTLTELQKATIPVSTGQWTFTLTATSGGTTLQGTQEQTIIVGNNSLMFSLNITDIGNGTGSLSITLNYASAENASSVSYATATLENLDGSEVTDNNNTIIVPSQNITPSESKVTFTAGDIPVGTYRAKIKLYAANDAEMASYRDLVQIATGCTSHDDQTIENLNKLYNVTYHLNDGALPPNTTLPETVSWKSIVNLPTLTRDEYVFRGWYTDEHCTDGNEITSITNAQGDIHLYAKFTLPSYTITYILNGGTNPNNAVNSYTVEDNVTLPEPSKNGSTFEGWYTTDLVSVTSWIAGAHHESLTLYAKWNGEILANASTVASTIRNMTANGTVRVIGKLNTTNIRSINSALKANSGVLVGLDLSQVTGLTSLEDADITKPNNSFFHCSNLSNLILPDGLQSIGLYGIRGCSNLTSITIPSSVTQTKMAVFYECNNLHEVIYNGTLEQWMNKGWYMECQINDLYINGEKLSTELTIPSSVTSIGNYAFYNYRSLKSVTIPTNVTSIGSMAFENCTGLTSITIPSSVVSIGGSAFGGCTGITEITIEAGVTQIGSNAFAKCNKIIYTGTLEQWINIDKPSFINSSYELYISGQKITSITIPSSVTQIGNGAFYNYNDLTEVTIPSSVTQIGNYAFYNCSGLTKITMEPGITSIGNSAFSKCTCLTSLTIPSGVTSIGYSAFSQCTGLTEVIMPSSITAIGYSAFSQCTSLKSITIPSGVTTIEYNTFSSCSELTEVIIPSSVTKIEMSAFYECNKLEEITIPSSVTSVEYDVFDGCENLHTIKYNGTLDQWLNKGWYLNCIIDDLYISGQELSTELTIPSNITSIGNYAFYNFRGLTKITIESGVTEIGDSAFYNCSGLTSISIPSSVTSIGRYTFCNCSSLKEIVLPSSITIIESYAFYKAIGLTKITIPSSVTQIGYYAFYNCSSLTSATFGNSSNWYCTTNSTDWNNYRNGTATTISDDAAQNATVLTTNYSKYFYRID